MSKLFQKVCVTVERLYSN